MSLFVCNKRTPKCKNCEHYDPHEPVEEYRFNIKCTEWGDCYKDNGEHIKVRCIKIKE